MQAETSIYEISLKYVQIIDFAGFMVFPGGKKGSKISQI